jgi:hypothetical protein
MTLRFSASVASMVMACPASANLKAAIPGYEHPERKDTGAAADGTAAHETFARVMEYSAKDMRAFAKAIDYVADIRSTRRFKVLIEQSVKAEWLQTAPDTTADLVLFTQDEIHVFDLKWGKIPVPVEDNHQLLYYGLCYAPLAPKAKGVTLHILQPRGDYYDSWFADAVTLKKFMDEAQKAEARLLAGDLTFAPSDHCTFCPANPHSRGDKGSKSCPAMTQLLYPRVIDEDAILATLDD